MANTNELKNIVEPAVLAEFWKLRCAESIETDRSQSTSASRATFATPALLETFLRALDRTPERLDHVQRLVTDLRSSEEGKQLLPPDFDIAWDAIWEARERKRACLVS